MQTALEECCLHLHVLTQVSLTQIRIHIHTYSCQASLAYFSHVTSTSVAEGLDYLSRIRIISVGSRQSTYIQCQLAIYMHCSDSNSDCCPGSTHIRRRVT